MSSCRDMLMFFGFFCFVLFCILRDCDNSVIFFVLSLQFLPVCLCTCESRWRATVGRVVSWAEVSSGEIERLALKWTHSGRCQDSVKSFPWFFLCIIHQHNFTPLCYLLLHGSSHHPGVCLCCTHWHPPLLFFYCLRYTWGCWSFHKGWWCIIIILLYFQTWKHDVPPLPRNHS